MTTSDARASFTAFRRYFIEYFELDGSKLDEDTRLVEDLGFDSIQVFEAVLVVEDMVEMQIPSESFEALKTVGDLYDACRSC